MTKHIIIFSLVSAFLHAGLFMMVPSSQNIIEVGAPFRVSILASREQSPAPEPAKQETLKKPVIHKTIAHTKRPPSPDPVKSAALADNPVTMPVKQQAEKEVSAQERNMASVAVHTKSVADAAMASTAMSAQTVSLLRAELQQAFRLQFYYPRLAVKRGWQGEVRLALRVSASGALENISIMKSSGHGILDRAALDSLGKVEQLTAAITLLHGQELSLELPVQYRLL